MSGTHRQLVLVSGPPGAGKSTLAGPLAAELGFALLAKDRIKETLGETLGDGDGELAWSQRLGAASMELLWALAADAPSAVLEANFWPDDERHHRSPHDRWFDHHHRRFVGWAHDWPDHRSGHLRRGDDHHRW